MGMPECELALAQAVVYLALAPKSNALYSAYSKVKKEVGEHPGRAIPLQLRNAPTRLMKGLGYGDGYVYAHDTPEGVAVIRVDDPYAAMMRVLMLFDPGPPSIPDGMSIDTTTASERLTASIASRYAPPTSRTSPVPSRPSTTTSAMGAS